MDALAVVQNIGEEVCEDCGPNADCGITPKDCDRIKNALDCLEGYKREQG